MPPVKPTAPRSPAFPAPWREAFEDLDEVARGVEVDGPIPEAAAIEASREFLSRLASPRLRTPLVGEVSGRGVCIEFPGTGTGTRLSFVVENDGSIAYYELNSGRRRRRRFPEVSAVLSVVWPSAFVRAGLVPPQAGTSSAS